MFLKHPVVEFLGKIKKTLLPNAEKLKWVDAKQVIFFVVYKAIVIINLKHKPLKLDQSLAGGVKKDLKLSALTGFRISRITKLSM